MHTLLRLQRRLEQSYGTSALAIFWALIFLRCNGAAFAAERVSPPLAEQAQKLFDEGAFEGAVEKWKRAGESYESVGRNGDLIDTLTRLGAAYHAMGQHRLASEALTKAVNLSRKTNDRARLAQALSGLGAIDTFSRAAGSAEISLGEALALARREGNAALTAATLNNLGNLFAAQERFPEALAAYREAIPLAKSSGDTVLAAKASANLAETAVRSGDFAGAAARARATLTAAEILPDSHDKAFVLMRVGKTSERLFEDAPEHDNRYRAAALQAYQKAATVAESIGDHRALSYALGYSGHLYEQEKKWADALRLTRRAAFLAQKTQSPDSLYLWEWQTGRIDKAEGRRDEAIADYRRAVRNIEQIRNDLSIRLGNINARSSFRAAVGDVFLELADLLLQRADGLHDEKELAATLRAACETCEKLKTVELDDYFQDDCVSLIQAKKKTIEDTVAIISRTAAVVYLIPLRDRTEIVVSLSDGMRRVKSPVAAEELTATVRAFREHLETRTTYEYLGEAAQLYDWLVRPLEPIFAERKIDTLIFVPDGALRTIPMAALHDGNKFLIEKFAVAVTPGLTLMEPKPIKRENVSMMVSGLSEAVQRDGEQFAALPNVEKEIGSLRNLYRGDTMLNREFLLANVEKEFAQKQYSIVHIASHGEFSGDVKKTFVLTYDGKLSLDRLEQLIRPSQLRDQPVELLSLSACQTAAGDDRAALGLAGVVVKAGARAAFATLWFVNDEASTVLISEFYKTLHDEPSISKARALQRAQVKLLGDRRYDHPCLWAPYLIIGNWL